MNTKFIRRLASLFETQLQSPEPPRPIAKLPSYALEPRIMLDAALVSTGIETLAETDSFQDQTDQDSVQPTINTNKEKLAEAVEAINLPQATKELVFIDPSVPEYDTLLEGMADNVQVHILSSSASLAEMAEVLSDYQNLDAIHIISHGTTGALSLSGETVDFDSLASQQENLASIGEALNLDGDILLYGCNVGTDGEGQAFIRQFAEMTGADIAASDDLTGTAQKGGDWIFETAVGTITTDIAISSSVIDQYDSVLSIPIEGSETPTHISNGIAVGQVFYGH